VDTVDVPEGIAASDEITHEELALAARNHGMPLEALRYDVTPLGMHYLLIHFDVPEADGSTWEVEVGGAVSTPLRLSMQDLIARPSLTQRVTMECAGNGRARLHPRPLSQPWLLEAVGTAEWTGTPLVPILEEAGLKDEAVELVFTGADHGTQGDVEQDYERSLTIEQATDPDVMLVYAINGSPLPPQHGYPLRLVVPGWYGMTNVKWLRRITAVTQPFDGFQMDSYRMRSEREDEGVAVTRMRPRALMIPPGFPDFFTRTRTVDAGEVRLEGRAWSGGGKVTRVEVSTDGGGTWRDAEVAQSPSRYAWASWTFVWRATPGEHELSVRATDETGDVQPVEEPWNHHGFENNMIQQVSVTVVERG
jgi:sulfane dehydrogenase subunit SoxC